MTIPTRFAATGTLAALIALATLAGCANYSGIGSDRNIRALDALPAQQSFSAERGEWPSERWWENFHDAQLNALVDEALSNSPQLVDAAARVAAANAELERARAAQMPRVDAGADATWQRYS